MNTNKPKKSAWYLKPWLIGVIFILGLILILYPFVTQFVYYEVANKQVDSFQHSVEQIENIEIEERMRLAAAYNEAVDYRKILDPWTSEQKEGIAEYARMLEVKEQIGYVTLPQISERLPIYAGTSEEILQKGVGHLEGTSLPIGGLSSHSVLTAHRGLPTARLFTDLDKLKIGDVFYVTNMKETLAYEVDSIKVVEPTALEEVRVVDGRDYLTLLTCTPYMINSHRLLVRGSRIPYIQEEATNDFVATVYSNPWFKVLLTVMAVLAIIILVIYFSFSKKVDKNEKDK